MKTVRISGCHTALEVKGVSCHYLQSFDDRPGKQFLRTCDKDTETIDWDRSVVEMVQRARINFYFERVCFIIMEVGLYYKRKWEATQVHHPK